MTELEQEYLRVITRANADMEYLLAQRAELEALVEELRDELAEI